MARDWKPRQPPRPTSLTEIARRYHAAAVALAQTLGLSVQEVLSQHRESVTAIFIESGRCDLRLPAAVTLPPLVTTTPVAATNGSLATVASDDGQGEPRHGDVPDGPPSTGEASPPTTVPAGLPCAGQAIATLKPAQLHMLLSKVDGLAAQEGRRWQSLLEALTAERQARLAKGQRPKPTAVAVPADGAA